MRIICLLNNVIGLNLLKYLLDNSENIIGVYLHPESKDNYKKEIINIIPEDVYISEKGHLINNKKHVNIIKKFNPGLIISAGFGFILDKKIIDIPESGVINLHTSYLPYNRGSYPNIWSIIEGSPAGVSLHYIDEGIDTGDIIARKRVEKEFTDTGKSLYYKLQKEALNLFSDVWDQFKSGDIETIETEEEGSYHSAKDVEDIDYIDLDRKYRARDLINILRARTFRPYKSAYVIDNGKKYYLRLDIEEASSDE